MTDRWRFSRSPADAAAKVIMPHFRASTEVTNKATAHFDPVTAADRDAEAGCRLIAATYTEHGIVGEEYGPERADARFVWVLDPIDGTRSFITGLPVWGTLIGLLEDGRPRLGMMAQPFTGERFAGDGRRAWYTGPGGPRPLHTRPAAALGDAALFTTSPYLFSAPDGGVSPDRNPSAWPAMGSTVTPIAWLPGRRPRHRGWPPAYDTSR
jgi:myo-inositol-1(or 4)-monophosphatase